MTKRQLALTAAFTVFWTTFMVVWSGNYALAHIAIVAVISIFVAGTWAWVMKRFGNWS